jgi:hypothetical protein
MDRKTRRRLKVVLERRLDATIAGRTCAECSACCTALDIPQLDKPAGEPCRYLGPMGGCSIYDERPKLCREYLCGWRIGIGDLRPDQVGVVITPTRPGAPGYPGMIVHELWPDAFSDAREYLVDLASRLVLVLVRDGRPLTIAGPDHLVMGMKSQIEGIQRENAELREAKAHEGVFAAEGIAGSKAR